MSEVRSFEPVEIFAAIDAQPPLMRKEAANAYIGKEVHWALTFSDGSEEHQGQASLAFHFDTRDIRMVLGRVLLSDYPSLKSMQSDEAVLVHGRVQKISAMFLELEIRDLVFAKAAEAAH